jgi:hypothetical protein
MLEHEIRFLKFFEDYSQGEPFAAFRKILTSPRVSYQDLEGDNFLFYCVCNYVDACVFFSSLAAMRANYLLQEACQQSGIYHDYPSLEKQLKLDEWLLRKKNIKDNQDVNSDFVLEALDKRLKTLLEEGAHQKFHANNEIASIDILRYSQLSERKMNLKEAKGYLFHYKRDFAYLLDVQLLPFQVFSYHFNEKDSDHFLDSLNLPWEMTPVFFLDNQDLPWKEISDFIKQRSCIFVFPHRAAFLQSLQFSSFFKTLNNPRHIVLVLGYPLVEQVKSQPGYIYCLENLVPITVPGNSWTCDYNNALSKIKELLHSCSKSSSKINQDIEDWGQWVCSEVQLNRMGNRRSFAYHHLKSKLIEEKFSGKFSMAVQERQLFLKRQKQYLSDTTPLSLIETPISSTESFKQLHYLSCYSSQEDDLKGSLVNVFVNQFKKDYWKHFLLCYEGDFDLEQEYPFLFSVNKQSSWESEEDIKEKQSNGVAVEVFSAENSMKDKFAKTLDYLADQKIDVITFYQQNILDLQLARNIKGPLKIFIDDKKESLHLEEFDLCVGINLESPNSHYLRDSEKYLFQPLTIKREVFWSWALEQESPLPKGPQAFVSISLDLDEVLDAEFCSFVIGLLKRYQHLRYYLFGGSPSKKFRNYFQDLENSGRVIYFDDVFCPGRFFSESFIYLHPFKEHHTVGLLEAWAANCPTVINAKYLNPNSERFLKKHISGVCSSYEDYFQEIVRLVEHPAYSLRAIHQVKKIYKKLTNYQLFTSSLEKKIFQLLERKRQKISQKEGS